MSTQCGAICEDFANGKRYNLRRVIVTPAEKQCSRKAKHEVRLKDFPNHRSILLPLCNVHYRLHVEGFVGVDGRVFAKSAIAAERTARARRAAQKTRLALRSRR